MVRSLFSRIALMTVLAASTHAAWAALDIGDPAPKFTANAALGGKTFRYSLADALAKGPVVLYFFPAADSNDCSIEAHAFAEAIDKFAALGATVIGVSADDIDTLSKFSVKSCQSRFPVASDEGKSVIQGFDAVMQTRPDFANRLSYVIAPDGKVAYYYQNLNPDKHVERTLNAVRALPKATAAK
ncbi:Peroxiredoxin [Variovorax sp. OK605]|jgi:peroxiredoxin|uniref:peroxiredoxin n=1 Tax=unclassified Variovorax TaxID=663243 RepID=UPI0008B0EB08|nr:MULTISPECIES: peroxiredoxin [unclassified Variovorax]SEJ68337.1 Peroxiredoxin [Variovorax sp. OK202]SFC77663.1 Peroxiredoxin [Variovorax sp. OK212]SFO60719.1 Peroxiredoxin [Variovorax sp. OK605]